MITLSEWMLVAQPGPNEYAEPQRVLRGRRDSDGRFIRTSPIVGAKKGIIITRSGTRYTLGEPCPKYVKWCIEQGGHVPTKEEPYPQK